MTRYSVAITDTPLKDLKHMVVYIERRAGCICGWEGLLKDCDKHLVEDLHREIEEIIQSLGKPK